MKILVKLQLLFTLMMTQSMAQNFSIAIHGGAGNLLPKNFSEEREATYRAALDSALTIGYEMLQDSASATDVCEAVVNYLENNPLFNAGRGSVFNAEGQHEMDASIMDGKTLNTGAVAGVSLIKNPVSLARLVLDSSEHVFLSGPGAETFGKSHGAATVSAEYFHNERRYRQWEKANKKSVIKLDHDGDADMEEKKHGTVGVAVMDVFGNLAAATSTGGMTNKKYGRVGDSPIIGAGTYANNATCAVSCTGHGEYFIRAQAAFEAHALMQYKGQSLQDACNTAIYERVGVLGGEGGMIAVDSKGNVAYAFNTAGMYRGSVRQDGEKHIAIFKTNSD